MSNCPCCSGVKFEECCGPILKTESATTALDLMRSRYSAYFFGDAEYLYNTNHPNTRETSALEEIKQWSAENNWTKLEIINVENGGKKEEKGFVEFKAYFTDKNRRDQVHYEKSTFLKENGKWFYLDGIANPRKPIFNKRISRNDPCSCGSGKKYKKCCG